MVVSASGDDVVAAADKRVGHRLCIGDHLLSVDPK